MSLSTPHPKTLQDLFSLGGVALSNVSYSGQRLPSGPVTSAIEKKINQSKLETSTWGTRYHSREQGKINQSKSRQVLVASKKTRGNKTDIHNLCRNKIVRRVVLKIALRNGEKRGTSIILKFETCCAMRYHLHKLGTHVKGEPDRSLQNSSRLESSIWLKKLLPRDPKKSFPKKGNPGRFARTIIRKSGWALIAFSGSVVASPPAE